MNAAVQKAESLPIAQILRDPALNCRAAGVNEDTAREYAEALASGAKLPPITVYYDGRVWRLADGFHRTRAHELAGKNEIECVIHKGGEREARLFSVGCNAAHGLRRSTADKKHAATVLLLDAEWSKKSDRWIADTCGVGHPFVAKLRGQVVSDSTGTREGRDGKKQSATKPKKGRKAFDAARAAKAAPKALAAITRGWPKNEPLTPLIEVVRAWLAEQAPTSGAT